MPSHFDRFLADSDSPLKGQYARPALRRLFSPAGRFSLTYGGLTAIPRDAWGEHRRKSERDRQAEAFELALLGWLEQTVGVTPVSCGGTNALFWEIDYQGRPVELVVVGKLKNTATSAGPGVDWFLRVEEAEPLAFIPLLEGQFTAMPRIRRKVLDGKIRTQFKSGELLPDSDLARSRWTPPAAPARFTPAERAGDESPAAIRRDVHTVLDVMTADPAANEVEWVARLIERGVSPLRATVLVWFIPHAFGRVVIGSLRDRPAVLPDTAIIRTSDGNLRVRLSDVPEYTEALAVGRVWARQGEQPREMVNRLAGRGAELRGVSTLLKMGELDGAQIHPTMFPPSLAEVDGFDEWYRALGSARDGVAEVEEHPPAASNSPRKPWWKFWG